MPLPAGYMSPVTAEERRTITEENATTIDEHAILRIIDIEDLLRADATFTDVLSGRLLTWPQDIFLAMAYGRQVYIQRIMN